MGSPVSKVLQEPGGSLHWGEDVRREKWADTGDVF